jgi:NTP pyrophosphatase (non-canonical NTP hydrolase)
MTENAEIQPPSGFPTLRAANIARQAEWDQDARITLSYRLNELAGETGEACNVGKKIERERLGIRGSRATLQQLAEELADVVICADLVAMGEGIDLAAAVAAKFNATSEKVGLATRMLAPDESVSAAYAASQDEIGARFGVTPSDDWASIPHCRAWFTDVVEAADWALAFEPPMAVWDLVEGRLVDLTNLVCKACAEERPLA